MARTVIIDGQELVIPGDIRCAPPEPCSCDEALAYKEQLTKIAWWLRHLPMNGADGAHRILADIQEVLARFAPKPEETSNG